MAGEDGAKARGLVRTGTTVDAMVRTLSQDIVSGALPPGENLDESGLAGRFGSSRTPVREALRQLAAMGLVERPPNRRARVAIITDARLTAMFEAMAELEATCARLSAQRMSARERQLLAEAHEDSAALLREGSAAAYAAHNIDFHTRLYDGARNEYLRDLVLAMRERLAPFRDAQFRLPGRVRKSWDEHDAIVRAILRADPEEAARATRAHMVTVSAASAEFITDPRPQTHPE